MDSLTQRLRMTTASDAANMPTTVRDDCHAAADRIAALEAQLAESVSSASMLSNLLARIHRDGGHYEAEHGTRKACVDADDIVAHLYATPPAPEVTEAGPVPTYECEFRVGQPVRLANPYAEDDPDRTFYVTGIDWEYRSVVGHGWNITVATAEEIARGYGATDGFTPSDLTAAQEAGKL